MFVQVIKVLFSRVHGRHRKTEIENRQEEHNLCLMLSQKLVKEILVMISFLSVFSSKSYKDSFISFFVLP